MKINRSIWLIGISLTLLGVFEGFWLTNVWKEQYERLEQTTELVFQRTVASLQDSMLRRNMEKQAAAAGIELPVLPQRRYKIKDHNARSPLPPSGEKKETLRMKADANLVIRMDTNMEGKEPSDTFRYDQVQVFVASADSLPQKGTWGMDRLFLNLPKHIRRVKGTSDQYFQIQMDTIAVSELTDLYTDRLAEAEILLPFELLQSDTFPNHTNTTGIQTQPAFAGLLTHRFYSARFPEYRAYLFRQMLPSIAFALLLFGITCAAFIFIFRSLQEQHRLTRLKNEFISNITHELKTPITTVGVALEALSDFQALQNPEKTREYLAHSKLELDRLSLLVDKVLRVSMFEEQAPVLKLETLDLGALVEQVAAAMSIQAERAGADMQVNIAPGPMLVKGDRLHLSSVVYNLIDNALKYTKEKPQIKVDLYQSDDRAHLRVQDNGIGISSEEQAQVFEKFYRVANGDTHNVKGHGLGLSYTAQVIRQHQGKILVNSAPGEGSTFIVELPAQATATTDQASV